MLGERMDNSVWAIIGGVCSGIIAGIGTTASMRRANRDERRKETGEIADAKVSAHAATCRFPIDLADVIERNRLNVSAELERSQKEMFADLENERNERKVDRGLDQVSLEHMRVEIVGGQKEILERVIVIQSTQATQNERLDNHSLEIMRLRDGKNGGPR